jgi:hypothetical protein
MNKQIRYGISVTGPFAEYDRPLLEAGFGSNNAGCVAPGVQQVEQLRRNKLAAGCLPCKVKPEPGTVNADTHHIVLQKQQHGLWEHLLTATSRMFDELDIRYVLIKALTSPFAIMSDLDFLIPYPEDIARAAAALEASGFALYRFRLLAHPLKIMAVTPGEAVESRVAVDIYPDGMWIRKHVIDGVGVLARRQFGTIRGASVWLPCDEDNLYLIATHAFSHGRISLAELDHGYRILSENGAFDWQGIIRTASAFGCIDGLYTYLALLSRVTCHLGLQDVVPGTILDSLSARPVNRSLSAWIRRNEPLILPVRLPLLTSTIRSALFHLPSVFRRITARECFFDGVTHGLAAASRLLGRD